MSLQSEILGLQSQLKSQDEIGQKKTEALNQKTKDMQTQIDSLNQDKKNINTLYQEKMQGLMKEKEDLTQNFSHIESKLSKVELDREQLKLQSTQQKESISQKDQKIKEQEQHILVLKEASNRFQDDLTKLKLNSVTTIKSLNDQISKQSGETQTLLRSNEELQRKISDF